MRVSPELTGWLRAPAADRYVKDLQKQAQDALELLLGTSSCSEDPRVREHYIRWKTLTEQIGFLTKARKESATDDE